MVRPAQYKFDERTAKISGTTYDLAKLKSFRLKPTSKRKIGLAGIQYTYTIQSRKDMDDMLDLITLAAQDFADVHGPEHHSYLQMVKDAGHLM